MDIVEYLEMRCNNMTKREYYFKDDITPNQAYDLLFEFIGYISLLDMSNQDNRIKTYDKVMEFLNQNIKPNLTEDEKAILRNIDKKYKVILRQHNNIWIMENNDGIKIYHGYCLDYYNYTLFKFIKERRAI